jgi:hypothetical protein
LPGGAINASHATKYTGPFTLTESVCVKARVFYGAWSAVHEAVFAIGPVAESLRINEIMYHPDEEISDLTSQISESEFIELTNVGTETIHLGLVRFTNGIDFTFPDVDLPPGKYCLVVKDIAAFEARYGPGLPVASQYAGALANDGERIELVDAIGRTIHDFRYEDNWYDTTDGSGFSLTIADPIPSDPAQWSEKDAWRPSTHEGGSPGTVDGNANP